MELGTTGKQQGADPRDETSTAENLLCAALVRSGVADGCGAVLVLDPERLRLLVGTDDLFEQLVVRQLRDRAGAFVDVFLDGEPVVVDDFGADAAVWPRGGGADDGDLANGVGALAALPLALGDSFVGIFAAYRTAARPFDEDDLEVVLSFRAGLEALISARWAEVRERWSSTSVAAVVEGFVERGLTESDAMAVLRARAWVTGKGVVAVADQIAEELLRG